MWLRICDCRVNAGLGRARPRARWLRMRWVTAGLFEIRLVEDSPGNELIEAEIQDSGEKVYLHRISVIAPEDIANSEVVTDSLGQPAISVEFTDTGAEKMAFVTKSYQGKRLALVVDGQVIALQGSSRPSRRKHRSPVTSTRQRPNASPTRCKATRSIRRYRLPGCFLHGSALHRARLDRLGERKHLPRYLVGQGWIDGVQRSADRRDAVGETVRDSSCILSGVT